MGDVTENLVATLRLLESRAVCPTADLAATLQVTDTTVRRYVARLRGLGLTIVSEPGPDGGYRLAGGRTMPPLVLDDEEATAVTIALRRALQAPAPLVEEGTIKALAAIQQVLPDRVRESVAAHDTEVTVAGQALERALAVVAEGLRAGRVLKLRMVTGRGPSGLHLVEPLAVRARSGQWLLTGYDRDLGRTATWPVEQLADVELTPIRFARGSGRARRARGVVNGDLPTPVVAVVEVQAPAARVRAELPEGVGFIEPLDGGGCRLMISGASTSRIARQLLLLPEVFTVVEPEELRVELRGIAEVLSGV